MASRRLQAREEYEHIAYPFGFQHGREFPGMLGPISLSSDYHGCPLGLSSSVSAAGREQQQN
eukprot:606334-Hanusia_phi.AAC.3